MVDTLQDVASVIRSKNAGPYEVTLDVLFRSEADLDRVLAADAVNVEAIARLYDRDPSEVAVHVYRKGLGIKVTMPRPASAGSFWDTDLYGAQQHVPLMTLAIGGGTGATG